MERVSIALVTVATIATATPLAAMMAQSALADPAPNLRGAALLQTRPVSISEPPTTSGSALYTGNSLNRVSATIQAPSSSSQQLVLPAFVPRNLEFSPAPVSNGPLDFFRVQAPDRGVRFRVGESP